MANSSLVKFIKRASKTGNPGISNVHIRDAQSRREEALSDMLVIGSLSPVNLGSAVISNDIEYTPPE